MDLSEIKPVRNTFLNTRPFQFFKVLLANRRVQLLCQNAGNPLL